MRGMPDTMTTSERSRLSLGGLLILAALALGAGSSGWAPVRPDGPADPAAPLGDPAPADAPAPAEAPALAAAPAPAEAAEPAEAEPAEADEAAAAPLLVIEGRASWYADALAGRATASGERYDPTTLIAAHRALPFGTRLRVMNLDNGRVVEVRVVDRGPFVAGRVIDLSRRAAEQIGMIRAGHARVRIEVLEYGA